MSASSWVSMPPQFRQLVLARPSPEKFGPLAEAKILDGDYCWTPPVVANGKVYCRNYIKRSRTSEIICIDLTDKKDK